MVSREDATIDSLAERALGELLQHGRADLGGLGTMTVRTAAAFSGRDPRTGEFVDVPVRRLPFLNTSALVRDYVNEGGPRPAALEGPLGTLIDRARAGDVVVFGTLGELRVLHREGATAVNSDTGDELVISPVSIATFRPSQQVRHLLDGYPRSSVPAADVDEVIASTPLAAAPPVQEVEALIALLARDYPETEPCTDPELRDLAQAEHEALCELFGKRAGIVFTRSASEIERRDTDHWALESSDSDPFVFRTQGRNEPPLRLSRWLGEHFFLARMRRVAGDRFLSAPDWRRVVAHIDGAVPGFTRRVHGLPF